MRIYNIPLNADLVDMLGYDGHDIQKIVELAHVAMVIDFELKISGAICSSVEGRGHPCKAQEMIE